MPSRLSAPAHPYRLGARRVWPMLVVLLPWVAACHRAAPMATGEHLLRVPPSSTQLRITPSHLGFLLQSPPFESQECVAPGREMLSQPRSRQAESKLYGAPRVPIPVAALMRARSWRTVANGAGDHIGLMSRQPKSDSDLGVDARRVGLPCPPSRAMSAKWTRYASVSDLTVPALRGS